MAIVNFSTERNRVPADAVNFRAYDGTSSMGSDVIGPRLIFLWDTYTGCCISEYESNGYHDSDFYMVVWDEAKQAPQRLMFASTRGWSYPALGSRVDATDEVLAKYKAWGIEQQRIQRIANRHASAVKLLAKRCEIRAIAAANGVNYSRLLKLRKHPRFDAMIKLFSPRIRNGFKLSMRSRLIDWCNTNSSYSSPFTKRMMEFI